MEPSSHTPAQSVLHPGSLNFKTGLRFGMGIALGSVLVSILLGLIVGAIVWIGGSRTDSDDKTPAPGSHTPANRPIAAV